ncbi:glycoside hydrolase [Tothia fuscella]|uniref:Glycoside hydrolase n=1 Tax=Tothia fuscella TaxID=1048955 RepID=A0A9P4TYE0_9PEZI|nr:glycoside hydrolase [Tothia fuscella]
MAFQFCFSRRYAGSSELECVKAWVKKVGIERTREVFERRWKGAVREEEWVWLRDVARVTTIRLPIDYFTLGPQFCKSTPFEGYWGVYFNAWAFIKEFVSKARSFGIGVLIYLHALPGGANKEEPSGTNSTRAELWGNRKYLGLARDAVLFIARQIAIEELEGVVGIQLCNEAVWDALGMYRWYDDVIDAVSEVDPTIPLYISDAWDLCRAIDYARRKNNVDLGSGNSGNPIIVDTHVYFCFSEADSTETAGRIIQGLPKQLAELEGKDGDVTGKGAVGVVVGEWSCTLALATWIKSGAAEAKRREMTKEFGRAQCERWEEKAAGSFFWTLKVDWMDGGDWGFIEQTKSGGIVASKHLIMGSSEIRAVVTRTQDQKDTLRQRCYSDHIMYWDNAAPLDPFEHWTYAQGWDVGWGDATAFFKMRQDNSIGGGDRIGCLDLWVRKRLEESGMVGKFVWEFEGGLRKGISCFWDVVGVGVDGEIYRSFADRDEDGPAYNLPHPLQTFQQENGATKRIASKSNTGRPSEKGKAYCSSGDGDEKCSDEDWVPQEDCECSAKDDLPTRACRVG